MSILSGLLVIIMNQYVGVYHSWRGRSLFEGVFKLFKSWLMVWTLLIILAFIFKVSDQYSRFVLITWFILTPIILISYRYLIRLLLSKLYKSGIFVKKAIILGTGDICERLKNTVTSNHWLGYRIVGIYDSPQTKLNTLVESANKGEYQTVFIALPASRESELKNILNAFSDTTVAVKYVPDFFSFELLHASMTSIGGLPVLSIFDTPLNDPGKAFVKRLGDIIISLCIIILMLPIMLMVAIGIKITSPGPVFYKQSRIGWNGRTFTMIKFRSMPVNVEKNGAQWGSSKDKTSTKFGLFIRNSNLDELPQFINVLKGEMSIVGPRPERDIFVKQFRKQIPRYMQKHLVKAGITGWAQINGWRGDTDLHKRIEYDLFYIDNWSLWFDFRIIFLTIFKSFINKNVY